MHVNPRVWCHQHHYKPVNERSKSNALDCQGFLTIISDNSSLCEDGMVLTFRISWSRSLLQKYSSSFNGTPQLLDLQTSGLVCPPPLWVSGHPRVRVSGHGFPVVLTVLFTSRRCDREHLLSPPYRPPQDREALEIKIDCSLPTCLWVGWINWPRGRVDS